MEKIKRQMNYILIAGISALTCVGTAMSTFFLSKIISYPNISDFVRMVFYLALSILIIPVSSLIKSSYIMKSKYEHREKIINSSINKRMLYVESEAFSNKINFLKGNNKENELISYFCSCADAIISLIALAFLLSSQIEWSWAFLDVLFFSIVAFLSAIPNFKLSKMMSDFWMKYIQNTKYYNYFSDVLTKKEFAEERKVYGTVDYFSKTFDSEFDNAAILNKKLGKERIALEEKNDLIDGGFAFLEITFLAFMCKKNFISINFFVSILPFVIFSYSKVCMAINGVNSYIQARCYLKEENDFASIEERQPLGQEKMDYSIMVDGLSFAYPNSDRLILNDISFNFEKGKKYAIVGVNGSGKTTLAKLISGLYEPTKGSIKTETDVAILFQDFVKYPFSIGENVTLQKQYNKTKVENVLDNLGLNLMLQDMKKGLESELTNTKEDGVNLSGGQWQRLALARILYVSNDIVVLDEPTASLDPKIEIEIYKKYMKFFNNKTVIFITHRLGFVKDVDEILVLNDGKIVEHDSPLALLDNKKSFFYKMFKEQKSLYEE